jgi:hypothetical protein
MIINGEKYIKESEVKAVEFTGEETIASRMIGKKVIVRSANEGINAGIVVVADETGVELTSCRRLWYHKPLDSNLAWYEGVAVSGISSDSKVSGTVNRKVIIEKYSMTECSDEAFEIIMSCTNVKS